MFSNPFLKTYSATEQRILTMFWRSNDEDSFNGHIELTRAYRFDDDPWLEEVLTEHRHGRESWETYCFVHGLPTQHPGSWRKRVGGPSCKNATCATLAGAVWPGMRQQKATWALRRSLECEACAQERKRRCRVMLPANENTDGHLKEPFVDAPYLHPFNKPRYQAQLLRSLSFAKLNGRRVMWTVAFDVPVTGDEAATTPESLEAQRLRWQQLPDTDTAGIPGFLPLVLEIPLRFTQTDNRKEGVFKNSRGHLVGIVHTH